MIWSLSERRPAKSAQHYSGTTSRLPMNEPFDLLMRLKNTFPKARALKGPQEATPQERAWSFAGNWLAISKKELNNTSTQILQNLSDQNFIAADQSNPWYQFLTQQSTILPKTTAKSVRLVQFRTTVQDSHDRREFAHAIADLFSHLLTNFYLNENTLIIVQANGPETLTLVELESILQTIESDFMVKTQAFVGNYWPVDEQLAAIFNEEQAVFAKSTSSVSSLATLALDYYARPQLRKSPLAQQLNTILSQDAEIKDVVLALYQSAGNLSSAAKKLFLHRNTLQYRLERFYEATNLNLKQMDDLVLCYLLLTAFND